MFKTGDKVSYSFIPTVQRQSTIKEQAKGAEQWIYEPGEKVTLKGVIAPLITLYIPVRLPDGEIRHCRYANLTFGKDNKVSFKSQLPNWKGIKDGKEVIIPGKFITIRGIMVLTDLHIPVVVENEIRQIPYRDLTFKETK